MTDRSVVGQRAGLTFPLPKTRPPQTPPPPNLDFRLSEPGTPVRALVSLPSGRDRLRMAPRRDSRRNESGSKAGRCARRGRVGRGAHSRGLPRWVNEVLVWSRVTSPGRWVACFCRSSCSEGSLACPPACPAGPRWPSRPQSDASSAPALRGSATLRPEGGEGAGNGDPPPPGGSPSLPTNAQTHSLSPLRKVYIVLLTSRWAKD